jgi:hypothetical protein
LKLFPKIRMMLAHPVSPLTIMLYAADSICFLTFF